MKQPVLCKRLPNLAFDRSAQKRRSARSWVPSSLRSSAPGQCSRWASQVTAVHGGGVICARY
jgi:hypothetical protein